LVTKLRAASYNNKDQHSTSNTLINSTAAARFGLLGHLQENHSKYDKNVSQNYL
jgi:hypothetical protein